MLIRSRLLLLLLLVSGDTLGEDTAAGKDEGRNNPESGSMSEASMEKFMEQIRQAMDSHWGILQNIRFHTLMTKGRVAQLETQVKKLATKMINMSEAAPALPEYPARPTLYSASSGKQPCNASASALPPPDGGVSQLVEAMKELSVNYNRLLNSSFLSMTHSGSFQEDFDRLTQIVDTMKDFSGTLTRSPDGGEVVVSLPAATTTTTTTTTTTAATTAAYWGDVEDEEGEEEEMEVGSPSIVETHSTNVTVKAGDTAILNCRVKNLGNGSVVWVRSRDISIVAVGPFIYAPTDRFQVVHEEGSPDHQLKIRMVEERDQGAYACQMSLEPLVVHKIWLSVEGMEEVGGPSIVETHSTNVTVEEGGTAILNCRVKNLGDATVTWMRERDVTILTSGRYTYDGEDRTHILHHPDTDDWTITIDDVKQSDEGAYLCMLSSLPPVTMTVWLTVATGVEEEEPGGPIIVETHSTNVTVEEGDTAILNCRVDNLGDATVFWYRNVDLTLLSAGTDLYIADGRFIAKHKEGSKDWQLLITSVQTSDSGWYNCVVVADSPINHQVWLNVIGEPSQPEEEEPTIVTVNDRNVTAMQGEAVTLTCRVTDLGGETVTWTRQKDLHILTAGQYTFSLDERFSAVHQGEEWQLQISSLQKSDEGGYECQVSTTPPTTQIFYLRVVVTGKLLFAQDSPEPAPTSRAASTVKSIKSGGSRNLTAVLGHRATLTCRFNNLGDKTVAWIRVRDAHVLTVNQYPFISDERFSIVHQGEEWQLQISSLQKSDEGEYECQVSTTPPTTQIFYLKVVEPAPTPSAASTVRKIVPEGTKNLTAVMGDTATLTCSVNNIGVKTVSWMRDTHLLTVGAFTYSSDERFSAVHQGEEWQLQISSLQKSDEGEYECQVSTTPPTTQIFYLKVVEAPRNIHAVEGKTVTLTCRVSGQPPPTVHWNKDGVLLSSSRLQVNRDGDLIIRSVTASDAGRFHCQAVNTHGVMESSILLLVEKPTRIIKPPKDRVRARGANALFRCKATADSDLELKVEWLVNGERVDFLKNERLKSRPNNALVVNGVREEDEGVYTCRASTPLDAVTANATLTIRGKLPKTTSDEEISATASARSDSCPTPYERVAGEMCVLQVTHQKISWLEAADYCRSEGGGQLAWDHDNVLLRSYLEERHGQASRTWTLWPFWVGGREDEDGGVIKGGGGAGRRWKWVEGTRVSSKVWAPGQPRHFGPALAPAGVCMTLDGGQEYHAIALPCHVRRRFLCRLK
ncbi:hemicentin-2-like isoform X2 [Homarus americanus]|uniref:hemicentin-2-like isoform X2 n=1 Tax=Homarus americanus TaxID=6706 RepID=UPI001C455E1E|nr:hemicentin-2-like isoform X2 [Homarus americanus]